MGLKTTNYEIKELGISIPEAYAQITMLTVDKNGYASAEFTIQQNRTDIGEKSALDRRIITGEIDKTTHVYTQLYTMAKEKYFKDWEDDINDSN